MGWVGNSGISKATMATEGRQKPSGEGPRAVLRVNSQDLDRLSIRGGTRSAKKPPVLLSWSTPGAWERRGLFVVDRSEIFEIGRHQNQKTVFFFPLTKVRFPFPSSSCLYLSLSPEKAAFLVPQISSSELLGCVCPPPPAT